MKPGAILVMEGQASIIPALRERMPGVYIYLRLEAGGAAWDPFAAGYTGKTYAAYAAGVANNNKPDCLVPWNELNTEAGSIFPYAEREEGYRKVAEFAQEFIREYRASGTSVKVAFPAFSPGHQEDDFIVAAKYFRDIVPQYDSMNLHNYWTTEAGSHLSEWWGRRYTRQIAAYNYTGPVQITEFNREWNDSNVDRLAQELVEWTHALPNQIEHAMWFIASSPDPSFDRLEINNNRTIVEAFARLNDEVPQLDYYPVTITLDRFDAVSPGQPLRFVFKVTKEDGSLPGKGIATCTLNTPHGFDEWAYTGEVLLQWAEVNGGKANEDGVFEFRGTLPDIPDLRADAKAVLRVFYLGNDNGNMGTGSKDFTVALSRQAVQTSTPAPESPVSSSPGLSSDAKSYVFYAVGDIANIAAQAAQDIKAKVEDIQRYLSDPK